MAATSPHTLLVGNPTAQSGKNAARIEHAQTLLGAAGINCDFLATQPEGRTIPALANRLQEHPYQVVICQGGDGTFREAACGIIESGRAEQVALGMLPTGTANDQGKSFGLSSGEQALEHNVQVIKDGHETRLDAGRLSALAADGAVQRQELFFDSAGWGISARILAARNADLKLLSQLKPLGAIYRDQLVYAGAALRVFLESYVTTDQFSAEVECDGQTVLLKDLTDLIVKGTRVYAGAWVFDPGSRHDDGIFELVPFRGRLDWTSKAVVDLQGNPLAKEVLEAIGIEHEPPLRARSFSLSFSLPRDATPLAAQMDGEEFLATPRAKIEVLRRVLRLIVPQEYSDRSTP